MVKKCSAIQRGKVRKILNSRVFRLKAGRYIAPKKRLQLDLKGGSEPADEGKPGVAFEGLGNGLLGRPDSMSRRSLRSLAGHEFLKVSADDFALRRSQRGFVGHWGLHQKHKTLYTIFVPLPGQLRLSALVAETSQEEVAQKLGAKQQAVSRWVRGSTIPNAFYQQAIENAFGIMRAEWLTQEQKLALRALQRDEQRRDAKPPAVEGETQR